MMKKKIMNYIEANICPQFFYEEKLNPIWYLSLILPAVTGLLFCLTVGLDRYFEGIASVSSVVIGSFFGVVLGLLTVFFRSIVIKGVSAFTGDKVHFQELSYAIGASMGFPFLFSLIGFLCRVFFSFHTAGAFCLCGSLVSLIPLYYLMLYLNLGGIKKRKAIALSTVAAVGAVQLLVLRLILGL